MENKLTVFLLTVGSPQFKKTFEAIKKEIERTEGVALEIIDKVAPFSKACNTMLEKCKTPYFIQLDEDMILDKGSLQFMLETMEKALEDNPKIAQYVFRLRDKDMGDILGVKIYNYSIVSKYSWEDIVSTDRYFNKKLIDDGYIIKVLEPKEQTIGTHALYRSDYELFLKSATIGYKLNEKKTSSDKRMFLKFYNSSCSYEKYSFKSFCKLSGLFYGAMFGVKEDYNKYPLQEFKQIDETFSIINELFNNARSKENEKFANNILYSVFLLIDKLDIVPKFPKRIETYLLRKQFYSNEDRIINRYFLYNNFNNITIYSLDAIFLRLPLLLSIGGYKNIILCSNNRNLEYINRTIESINIFLKKDISSIVIDKLEKKDYRTDSFLIIKKENLKTLSQNIHLVDSFADIIIPFVKNQELFDEIIEKIKSIGFVEHSNTEEYLHLKNNYKENN